MKDTASHRKRNKSESDTNKAHDHKDHKEGHHKESHHKGGAKGQHGDHHGSQQSGHHGSQHGGRRISQHKMGRRGHEHGDHEHHDDHHHSASTHPLRRRTDTMLSRGGHSIHHESDKRSVGTNELATPNVFYENTYKLTPDCRFHEGKVRDVIRAVLQENITEKVYDPSMCGQKCQLISEIIKERVKALDMNRFKIVCMVMIGQVFDQSMIVTSRCLWDHRFDNSISVEYKRGDIIAIGLVFAVYAE